jgi:hypothetical protein
MKPQSSSSPLAILIPYRDREAHLSQILPHLQRTLKSEAKLYVLELQNQKPFNRGRLLNAGFLALRDRHEHFVFHDVDQLALEADFSRTDGVAQIASKLSQFYYRSPHRNFFGAVTMFSRNAFEAINGFSNEYWGWGFEDLDLRRRCRATGALIEWRKGRFLSLAHARDLHFAPTNRQRLERFSKIAFRNDGLSNLECKLGPVRTLPGGAEILPVEF